MKCLSLTLVIMISVLGATPSTYANEANFSNVTDENNQAASLVTEPVTITNQWGNSINRTKNLQQAANSISLMREQGCHNINPLELINNPEFVFKECEKQVNNQNSPHTQRIDYFKIPRLDSGISVTVTKF